MNLMPGIARVDGEEPERHWSRHNMVAPSTREMGPGSRQDTLEDGFGSANWNKFAGIGKFDRRHKCIVCLMLWTPRRSVEASAQRLNSRGLGARARLSRLV